MKYFYRIIFFHDSFEIDKVKIVHAYETAFDTKLEALQFGLERSKKLAEKWFEQAVKAQKMITFIKLSV